jgi:hypothetical protein
MCLDPTTFAVAGGATGALGSILGGFQNSTAAKYAASIAQTNATTALDEGAAQGAQIGQRVQRQIGQTRSYFGGANLNVQKGSPLMLQASSAAEGNIDKQLAMAGSLNQAAGQNAQAGYDEERSTESLTAGWLGAGTSMLYGLSRWNGLGGFGAGGGDPGTASVSANPFMAYGI